MSAHFFSACCGSALLSFASPLFAGVCLVKWNHSIGHVITIPDAPCVSPRAMHAAVPDPSQPDDRSLEAGAGAREGPGLEVQRERKGGRELSGDSASAEVQVWCDAQASSGARGVIREYESPIQPVRKQHSWRPRDGDATGVSVAPHFPQLEASAGAGRTGRSVDRASSQQSAEQASTWKEHGAVICVGYVPCLAF